MPITYKKSLGEDLLPIEVSAIRIAQQGIIELKWTDISFN